MKVIPYGRQSIDEDDIKAVVEVLKSDFLTQGPKVKEFEDGLAAYCGAKYAVVFSSGTSALHAAYFSLGVGTGHEIITSPITFVATANAALYVGARPVFVDVESDTANINPEVVEKAVTKKTKAIVPVHFAGHPADLAPLHELAKRHGLVVIEDACHALGASYKGKKIGPLSDMTVFSFHPVKHITTGEGGAVFCRTRELYEKLLMFRSHGITRQPERLMENHGPWYYEMQELGYNYRMTDIQCALGISQLKRLDSFIETRRRLAKRYDEAFSGIACLKTPYESPDVRSSYHLYVIRLNEKKAGKSRLQIFNALREKGIGVNVHYIPVPGHPYYRKMGFSSKHLRQAWKYYEEAITLPLYPLLEEQKQDYIISVLRGLLS